MGKKVASRDFAEAGTFCVNTLTDGPTIQSHELLDGGGSPAGARSLLLTFFQEVDSASCIMQPEGRAASDECVTPSMPKNTLYCRQVGRR